MPKPKKKNRSTKTHVPRALLVGIRTAGNSAEDTDESLDELARLVTTLGFEVVGRQVQRQRTTTGPTAIGAGKLTSLIHKTGKAPEPDEELADDDLLADVVVFDCELRPSQMRHIEGALRVEVMDRTGVIIEIFSRHAKTRASRMQVELARLNYLSPRIREVGSSGERQQGRGSGESALETERRRIRDRLAELKKELAVLQKDQGVHREVRSEQRTVALVGYTNAGKSSTMRALTGSDVLVEDKLFATLDTTVRALKPETKPRILVTDTVGFIKHLPHDLVASFRSTLEEARHASLLLYVVDGSDPAYPEQLTVVEEVLKDVGVTESPVLLVFNKADQINELARKRIQRQYPDAILMSALDKTDGKRLRERIIKFFETELVEAEVFAPWSNADLQREIHARLKILRAEHGEEGIKFTVRADPGLLKRILLRFGNKT